MDIFSAPFFFSGVRSKFGQYGDMIWWWWYDDDDDWWWWWWWISLKKLRKSHCVEDRPPQSLHSCQNRVDSTWRACHGPSRVTKTSASWVDSSLRLHFFAQFFSKNSRLFLRIIDALNDEWWLSSERVHDNNIRKVIKHFQKQRVWRENHKILWN